MSVLMIVHAAMVRRGIIRHPGRLRFLVLVFCVVVLCCGLSMSMWRFHSRLFLQSFLPFLVSTFLVFCVFALRPVYSIPLLLWDFGFLSLKLGRMGYLRTGTIIRSMILLIVVISSASLYHYRLFFLSLTQRSVIRARNREPAELLRRDGLTGLLNRRGFDEEAEAALREPGGRAVLIMMDINEFKQGNDLCGHAVGDVLLRDFARELRRAVWVRESGSAGQDRRERAGQKIPGNILGRTGGDEYSLLITEEIEGTLQRPGNFFSREFSCTDEAKTCTYRVSAGYARFPEQSGTFTGLCRLADSALYHARIVREGRLYGCDPAMEQDWRAPMGFNLREVAGGVPAALMICEREEPWPACAGRRSGSDAGLRRRKRIWRLIGRRE